MPGWGITFEKKNPPCLSPSGLKTTCPREIKLDKRWCLRYREYQSVLPGNFLRFMGLPRAPHHSVRAKNEEEAVWRSRELGCLTICIGEYPMAGAYSFTGFFPVSTTTMIDLAELEKISLGYLDHFILHIFCQKSNSDYYYSVLNICTLIQ